jgi:ubiquinone/menaquinone biosynthesis C-methylase UbiE
VEKTINFDQSTLPEIYSVARQLPAETMTLWLSSIREHIASPVTAIIDLGCGTGRFSIPLANMFNAQIYGLDPSRKMLSVAKQRDNRSMQVQYIRGNGEHIPFHDHAMSMAFMSMVLHHLENVDSTIAEIRRVLSHDGYLVIRNTTHEDIHQSEFLPFFPTAQQIDLQRMPPEEQIITQLTAQGFTLISSSILEQMFAYNYLEYYEKISQRGLSGLTVISDEEFHSGLKQLKHYCEQKSQNMKVWEKIHLFIFQQKPF